MKKKIFRIFYGLIILLVLLWAYDIFAETQADISIPPPEKFNLNPIFFLGLISGIFYKATVGTLKGLYRKKFSWKKLLLPTIITVVTSFPAIIFLLPHLANPSGKFLPDFLYAFAVSYILVDLSADIGKLTEVVTEKIESKEEKK
jgi:drug/metabolite transporter (DMT)-like permease